MKVKDLIGKRIFIKLKRIDDVPLSLGNVFDGIITKANFYNELVDISFNDVNLNSYQISLPKFIIDDFPNELMMYQTEDTGIKIKINNKHGVNEDTSKLDVVYIRLSKEDFPEYFAQKEKEKELNEKFAWFDTMQGYRFNFNDTFKQEEERLKKTRLSAISLIIKKDKELIPESTIKDAIKNGLVVKYPELKDLLVIKKKETIKLIPNIITKKDVSVYEFLGSNSRQVNEYFSLKMPFVELVDLGEYLTVIPYGNMKEWIIVNKKYFKKVRDNGDFPKDEIINTKEKELKNLPLNFLK